MAAVRTFGRRVDSSIPSRRMPAPGDSGAPGKNTPAVEAAKESAPGAGQAELPSLDDELREWKRTRKKNFRIPWRQLSLMAGLCFGIASFVLPDSVSDVAQWLLYALMAASFYAGLRKRRDSGD